MRRTHTTRRSRLSSPVVQVAIAAACGVVVGLGPSSIGRAGATAPPTWSQLPASSGGPTERSNVSIAYDAASRQLVLFGGNCAGTQYVCVANTWVWKGTSWSRVVAGRTHPSARWGASMAYDASSKQLILFGGFGGGRVLNDTWDWTGTTWKRLRPASSPPSRLSAAMTYDPRLSRLILFAGSGGSPPAQPSDTWSWNGRTWSPLSRTVSPGIGLISASMAYDPMSRQLLLFGGGGGYRVGDQSDTCVWSHGEWILLSPSANPGPSADSAMAYDPAARAIVFFGGSTLDSTWSWNGATWSELAPTTSPSARWGSAMAYDPSTSQMLLFGGTSPVGLHNDTWVYEP
jgi:Galactose oxidase, central domain